jgi:hypothetical protein
MYNQGLRICNTQTTHLLINIMAIRKAIATQLSNAAKALEKDQSKEQAGRLINGIRISLANVIMPNIPLSK